MIQGRLLLIYCTGAPGTVNSAAHRFKLTLKGKNKTLNSRAATTTTRFCSVIDIVI